MRKDSVRLFFELIRAGLWGDQGLILDSSTSEATKSSVRFWVPSDEDWNEVYRLATEQSVLGLVLAGLEHSDIKPPKVLLLQWIGEVQVIEQQNLAMNGFISELVEKMRSADIYTLLLKGQGIAQCYERPLWRSCGDIDFFLSDRNFKRAKEFLLPLASSTELDDPKVKHFNMKIDQWSVELHGDLGCGLSSRMDRALDSIQNDIFYGGNVRSWMNVNVQVFLPGIIDDVLIIFTHFLKHFYKGGIGLRQICDWCRLLYTYRDSLNLELLDSRIRKAKLMTEWMAFGTFAVEYLGMPIEAMPLLDVRGKKVDGRCEIEVNLRKKADKICEFILEVGNFGHNRDNSYFQKHSYFVQKCISAWRRVWDLGRHARIFPINSIRFFFGIMYNGIVSAIRGE